MDFSVSIKKAKEMIKESVACYLQRDEEGNLLFPVKEQMPLELVGPPGARRRSWSRRQMNWESGSSA